MLYVVFDGRQDLTFYKLVVKYRWREILNPPKKCIFVSLHLYKNCISSDRKSTKHFLRRLEGELGAKSFSMESQENILGSNLLFFSVCIP